MNISRRVFLAGGLSLASSRLLAAGGSWEQDVINLLNAFRLEANQHELALHGYYRSGPRLPLVINPKLTEASALWVQGMQEIGDIAHEWPTNLKGNLVRNGVPISRKVYPFIVYPEGPYTDVHAQVASTGLATQGEGNICGRFNRATAIAVAYGFYYSGYNADPWLAAKHYYLLQHPFWTHIGAAIGPLHGDHGVVIDFARLP